MMDAKELRIGNYLNSDGKIIKVESFDPTKDFEELSCTVQFKHFENGKFVWYDSTWLDYLSPIPLTEEILIKAGLKNGGYENLFWSKKCKNGKFEINAMFYTNNTHAVGVRINDEIDVNIEFIHQLQNLYFVLTGEELQINL